MSLLNLLGISDALASTSAQPTPTGGLITLLPMIILFVAVMYFFMIRPQMKRQKEHQQLVNAVGKGDEVITNGGLVGTVTKVSDNFVVLTISQGVNVTLQKSSIHATLPKGTLKSIEKE